MRHVPRIYGLLALAAVLTVVAWGCSTDSPSAPRQTPVPPSPPGQAFNIGLGSDPRGITLPEEPTGLESATVAVEVSPAPADGTTILLSTNIGQFDPALPVREAGVALVNGRAFVTLYVGLPVQLGIATVQATLEDGRGEIDIPIAFLFAEFDCNNPESNLSINFVNLSSPEANSFLWNFGDGDTSTETSPLHVYDSPGVYNVTLTARRTIGQIQLEASLSKPVDTADTSCS